MSDPTDGETLSFGAERAEGRTRLRPARPVLVAALVVAALVATALVVRAERGSAPLLPTVRAANVVPDAIGPFGRPEWREDANGRPDGPVEVSVEIDLDLAGGSTGSVELAGVAGPGVADTEATPSTVPLDDARTRLRAELDCTAVPLPVPEGTYGIGVRAAASGRTTDGVLPLGTAEPAWNGSVAAACGSWLARRDLTVTRARGVADPLLPEADLTLTVRNEGAREATVALSKRRDGATTTLQPAGTLTVAPGSEAGLGVGVVLDQCDRVTEAAWLSDGATTTEGTLGLVATIGAAPDRAGTTPWYAGDAATGIPFAPSAERAVEAALLEACGDLNPFAVLIAENGAGLRIDRATGVLEIDLEVVGSPGRVRDVTLSTNALRGVPEAFTPLWRSTGALVPDFTGKASTTVRYRAPEGRPCDARVALPGFTITARVPVQAGVRTLRFGDFMVPWQESVVAERLCPPR